MNLLFVNNSEVNPLNSGIQRITTILAKSFATEGNVCFGAYFEDSIPGKEAIFVDKIKLDLTRESSDKLRQFIDKNHITRILVQECFPLQRLTCVYRAIEQNSQCQLLYCFHSMPGKEFVRPHFPSEFFRLLHSSRKVHALKKLLVATLPPVLYRQIIQKKIQKEYAQIYRMSHKVVLLSQRLIPLFAKLSGVKHIDSAKFIAIGNALSFEEKPSSVCLSNKKKEVIIVSRLSEREKRISTALSIWKNIEQSGMYNEWKLTILGSGPDENYYHHLARKLKLQRVHFEGRQSPKTYYERASLLMLTSSYEGFGMVLTEAQQMGTVPIAFSSFPAIFDIIEHQKNGILIPYGDVHQFTNQLMALMDSPKERVRMAKNGLASCQLFSEKNMINQWLESLNQS